MTNNLFIKVICIILSGFTLSATLSSCSSSNKISDKQGDSSLYEDNNNSDKNNKTILSSEELSSIDQCIESLKKDSAGGYSGKNFGFIGSGSSAFPTDETITGNEESDAVYKRNVAVEDTFDVKIINTLTEKGPVTAQMVKQDADSGLNVYHLAFGENVTVGAPLFKESYLAPISDFSQINTDNSWWLSTMEEYYAIGNKLFFLSGDILPGFFDTASCVLFSKKIMEDYGITENLYDLVKNGEWTTDKMFEIASAIPGGDIKRYGNPNYNAGISLLFGSAQTITKFDNDHIPYIEKSLPKEIEDLAVKISAQTGNESFCAMWTYHDGGDIGELELRDMFSEDRFLFSFDSTYGVSSLRESDVNGFGILPTPKNDRNQKNYISYCFSDCIYIPRSVSDKDMVGTVTEAMAAYSYMYVRPAFYDQRLRSKSVYDMESKEMLDIIYSSQAYDLYDLYGDGSWETGNGELYKMINKAVFLTTEGLSSKYASTVKVTQNKIKSMIKTAEAYDE